MNLIFGTHNSWSYQKPARFWMRPFQQFSRCQDSNIYKQFLSGARLFDLRLGFDRLGVKVCHGLVDYSYSLPFEDLGMLNNWAKNLNLRIYVRVLLETRNPSVSQIDKFIDHCLELKELYPNIHFYGGHGAHGKYYKRQYCLDMRRQPTDSDGKTIQVYEKYSSVCATGLKRIMPHAWAQRNNRVMRELYNDEHAILMLDYVEL